MTALIQAKLEEELSRLVIKYGRGKELKVVHKPRNITRTIIGKTLELCGEVIDHTIYVYDKKMEEALDTVDHEYFEYVFNIVFVRRHQTIFNAMIDGFTTAFEKEFYSDKEAFIETLVKAESKERKKE